MPSRSSKLRPVQAPEEPTALDHIRLTADRILVDAPSDSERKSKGGLLIPATAATPVRHCVWSAVVLIGPETRNVRPGDHVLFIPQSGLEVDVGGETYLLLRERDVQAVTAEQADRHSGQYL
jgi:chaperonin GroES